MKKIKLYIAISILIGAFGYFIVWLIASIIEYPIMALVLIGIISFVWATFHVINHLRDGDISIGIISKDEDEGPGFVIEPKHTWRDDEGDNNKPVKQRDNGNTDIPTDIEVKRASDQSES